MATSSPKHSPLINGLIYILSFRWVKRIRFIPPHEREFYRRFSEIAESLVEASNLLIQLVEKGQASHDQIAHRIALVKQHGKTVRDAIKMLINEAQQPPFNRSDISTLTENAMKTIKAIDRAAQRFMQYRVESDETMRKFADDIQAACEAFRRAMKSLDKRAARRRIPAWISEIVQLENDSDVVYDRALSGRYANIMEDLGAATELMGTIKSTAPDSSNQAADTSLRIQTLESALSRQFKLTRHLALFVARLALYGILEDTLDYLRDAAETLGRMVENNA
ncbi:MAG: DUF47 family protein [Patescibacteria group bacterium]|nr:DUF47 family protein [Patescibacteria group bacterium]MDD5715677.1 DUF47 family protein [Patescibacteria group bacterium]